MTIAARAPCPETATSQFTGTLQSRPPSTFPRPLWQYRALHRGLLEHSGTTISFGRRLASFKRLPMPPTLHSRPNLLTSDISLGPSLWIDFLLPQLLAIYNKQLLRARNERFSSRRAVTQQLIALPSHRHETITVELAGHIERLSYCHLMSLHNRANTGQTRTIYSSSKSQQTCRRQEDYYPYRPLQRRCMARCH